MGSDEERNQVTTDGGKGTEPVSFPIVDPEPDTRAANEPVSFPIVDPEPDTRAADEPVSFPIVDPEPDNSKG